MHLLSAWERQARWVAARQLAALAAVAGPVPADLEDDLETGAAVGAALGLSPRTADDRVALARALAGPLAATAAALADGAIALAHARVLAEETDSLDDATAARVQAAVLARAGRETPGNFRRAVRRAVAAADPVGTEVRAAAAVADRGVRTWPEFDGMATLAARLPAADTELVYTALTAGAERLGPEHSGGIDARRADVLVGWARAEPAEPARPTPAGRRPQVRVTVDLTTLLGLAEQPGELAGYGPIPASVARALAADGDWRRWVTDPATGVLLDAGRRSYTPPAALREYLVARDGTCRFPGCPRSAERCDLDHQVPWDAGGTTDRANLGALCRRHHRLKTLTGWSLERHPDASVTWTSPVGLQYTVPPPRVPPDG